MIYHQQFEYVSPIRQHYYYRVVNHVFLLFSYEYLCYQKQQDNEKEFFNKIYLQLPVESRVLAVDAIKGDDGRLRSAICSTFGDFGLS